MNERKDFMDLSEDEIRSVEIDTWELTPEESREQHRVIEKRSMTTMLLQLCQRCEQIRTLGYPWKYCYVTCMAHGGSEYDMRPEDEAERMVFASNPTTKMLVETLEERMRKREGEPPAG